MTIAPPSPAAALLDAPIDWDTPEEKKAAPRALAVVPIRPPTLGDRVDRVEFIADLIERLDDEALTDEVRDALSAGLIAELAGTRAKVDATSAALACFESLAAASTREIERLEKRVARYDRQRDRLERYVLAVLETSQLDRIEGETSTLARRLNPPAVVIEDGADIPHEYMSYPEAPAPHPDKAAIAKALKAKRRVPGCSLQQRARLVRS